jgi:hypothetical protein
VVICCFIYIIQTTTTPTDTKIVVIILENKDKLLDIDGVVGAGIAKNEKNSSIGIAVYIEDDIVSNHLIPRKINDYHVYIKKINETSEIEKEGMIISSNYDNDCGCSP